LRLARTEATVPVLWLARQIGWQAAPDSLGTSHGAALGEREKRTKIGGEAEAVLGMQPGYVQI